MINMLVFEAYILKYMGAAQLVSKGYGTGMTMEIDALFVPVTDVGI